MSIRNIYNIESGQYKGVYNLFMPYNDQSRNIPVGVVLLYTLVKDMGVKFIYLVAESEEGAEQHDILREYDRKLFVSLECLADTFRQRKLVTWYLKCRYSNLEIAVSGNIHETVLSVESPVKAVLSTKILSMIDNLEWTTYKYHDFGQPLVESIARRFGMYWKDVVRGLAHIRRYPDIYAELMSGLESAAFKFPEQGVIEVEGYTAESIYKNTYGSIFTAYIDLVNLRDDPEKAKGYPNYTFEVIKQMTSITNE